MGTYRYKARSANGKTTQGNIVAINVAQAKQKLSMMRVTVLTLSELDEKELAAAELLGKAGAQKDSEAEDSAGFFADRIFRDKKGNLQVSLKKVVPTTKDIIIFSKQFATMLGSGVPMVQALTILSRQQSNVAFERVLVRLKLLVENGSTLSQACATYPKVFDTLYVAMMEAGEASGNLDTILVKLVSYIEKSEKIRNQIKSAMSYPILVFVVATGVVACLLAFVVPTFAQQYAENGRELPGLTQFVIDFSNLLVAHGLALVGCVALVVFAFRYYINTTKGREVFDDRILRAPLIGELLRKIAVGRFCATMSSMLTSGVNLLEALSICAASSGNVVVEKFVLNVRKSLEKGSKFSEPLGEGDLFPEMVVSMVSVGEATGALDEMLAKVSEFYEEEVDLAVETMLAMIEPIMIVFIGGAVGFIVIAMYLPIFEMAGGA